MTITLGPVQKNNSTAGTTLSVNVTAAAGDILYAGFTSEDVSSTVTCSDGVSFTQIDTVIDDTTNVQKCGHFYRENVSAGIHTITFTWSVTSGLIGIFGVAISGGATSGSLIASGPGQVQETPTTATDAVTSGTVQNVASQPALVIGVSMHTGATPGTPPANGTGFSGTDTMFDVIDGDRGRIESKRITSTGNQQATFTAGVNESHITLMAVFKELSAGGGPTINTQPQSQTVLTTQTATFTVSATTSGGTLHYQWKQNGSNVGTDSSSYTTSANTLSNNGDIYTVVVTDDNGNITSSNAVLTVLFAAGGSWFRA